MIVTKMVKNGFSPKPTTASTMLDLLMFILSLSMLTVIICMFSAASSRQFILTLARQYTETSRINMA